MGLQSTGMVGVASPAVGQGYDPVARALHWSMALLMAVLLPIGMYCAWLRGIADRIEDRADWLMVHKSLGLAMLALAAVRLAWRLSRRRPAWPAALPRHERLLAGLVHAALYLMLFAAPLSGLLLSQGAGQTVSFFGLFDLPQLVPIDPGVPAAERPQVQLGALLHKVILKYGLLALLALHVLGVAKHHWLDRDPTVVQGMWGGR